MPSDNEDEVDKKNNSNDMDTTEVSASTQVRLPPFWANNPKLWFLTAEVQFSLQKITKNDTKLLHLIASLSTEGCNSIQDILELGAKDNSYEIIKAALIERNSMSQERKLEALIDKSEMGDMRPSEVLRQIKMLAGSNYTPELIISFWLRKLPGFIRMALVPHQEDKTLDEMAKTGDKLFEAMQNEQAIGAVAHQARRPKNQLSHHRGMDRNECHLPSTSTPGIEERITKIEVMLARLTSNSRSRSRSRQFRSQSRNRSHSRNRSNSRNRREKSGVCWYHLTFGAHAQKCTKPCNFAPNNSAININKNTPNE